MKGGHVRYVCLHYLFTPNWCWIEFTKILQVRCVFLEHQLMLHPGSQASGWFRQSVAPEATFCSRREMPHHLEKNTVIGSRMPTSHTSGQTFDSCIRANEHHLEDWHGVRLSDEKIWETQRSPGQLRKTKGDKHRNTGVISKDFKCT